MLEGSRAFRVGGGTLTPGLELGLRHDGGDAETGTGVELGGRIAYEDPETGLGVEARARTLIAHEDSDYREWGASGSGTEARSGRIEPAPAKAGARSHADRFAPSQPLLKIRLNTPAVFGGCLECQANWWKGSG